MRRRWNGILIGTAALAALVLTVYRETPEGLAISFGDKEVRAAPGAPASSVAPKHNLTKLKIFNLALVRIRDSYVDPERIDPQRMLYESLDSVQFNVPEVLVEPYPERNEVVVVVNDKRRTFATDDVDSPWRLSSRLKRIFGFIQANMNPGADLAAVEYAAVNGMLSTLDPHSVLLDPEAAREMDISTSGGFGGLGIVIRMIDNKLTVVRPMPDTPAIRAGVESGDHIVMINGEPTEHLTLNQAVQRMRGKVGTPVMIKVERKGKDQLLEFEITRGQIAVSSVQSKMLDKKVGYLKLTQFSSTTARDVKRHMRDLANQGATAWVVDLRWNPGGLLEQAIQVADLFVDRGTIVTTVGGRQRDARRARKKGTERVAPVAVLVNGSSASASEIVAGALKNLDRAVVIGDSTFGKGSVQILYDNKEDASKLKLTIAEYLTPGDLSIQSVGIQPDISLVRMYVPDKLENANDRIRLLRTKHTFKEKDLESALTSKHAKAGPRPVETLRYLYERPAGAADAEDGDESGEEEPVDTDEIVEDFEIKFARDLLAQAKSPRRTKILTGAESYFDARGKEQESRVVSSLGALGIDWSAPPAGTAASNAKLEGTISLTDENGAPLSGNKITAGQTITVTGSVTNKGSGPAYRVLAEASTSNRLIDELELVFGKVEPGKTRSFSAKVKVPSDMPDRVDRIAFSLSEALKAPANKPVARLEIQADKPPMFAYRYRLVDDGNGDGLIQKGEHLRLQVEVKNTGDGKARELTALLTNKSGGDLDSLIIKKGRFQVDEGLKPGASKTFEFAFEPTRGFDRNEVILELTVYDPVMRETVSDKIRYNVSPPSAGPAREKGSVRFISRGRTEIRDGAAPDSSVIALAPRGTVLTATGRHKGFVQVSYDGAPAFVSASAVRSAGSAKANARAVEQQWQVTPPTLAIETRRLETRDPVFKLRGTASDDTRIEDVYAFVSNRDAKVDNKKVFYRSNRGAKRPDKMSFSHEIPLWPGDNTITVVARENDQVRSAKVLHIYRDAPQARAQATPRPR